VYRRRRATTPTVFTPSWRPPGEGRLIWNQHHLLHALREYEQFYNRHRPHQGIANVRPLKPLPEPITDPDQLARLNIHRHDRLGGVFHEYEHAA
jgi:putative transposase